MQRYKKRAIGGTKGAVLSVPFSIILQGAQNFLGIGIRNHGRPWACEREEPVLKKMLWKVGVYSCLSERLIVNRRDSAKRVVSDTDTQKVLLEKGTDRTVPFVPLTN